MLNVKQGSCEHQYYNNVLDLAGPRMEPESTAIHQKQLTYFSLQLL